MSKKNSRQIVTPLDCIVCGSVGYAFGLAGHPALVAGIWIALTVLILMAGGYVADRYLDKAE